MIRPLCQAILDGRPCDLPATGAVWCAELHLACPMHAREPWNLRWLEEKVRFAALPEHVLCNVLALAQERIESIDTLARLNDERRREALRIQVEAATALEGGARCEREERREATFWTWSPPHAEESLSAVDVTDRLPRGAEVVP